MTYGPMHMYMSTNKFGNDRSFVDAGSSGSGTTRPHHEAMPPPAKKIEVDEYSESPPYHLHQSTLTMLGGIKSRLWYSLNAVQLLKVI